MHHVSDTDSAAVLILGKVSVASLILGLLVVKGSEHSETPASITRSNSGDDTKALPDRGLL